MGGMTIGGKLCWASSAFFASVLVGLAWLWGSDSTRVTDAESTSFMQHGQSEERTELFTNERPLAEDFPTNTRVLLDTPNARGWKQMGEFPMGYEDAVVLVAEMMARRGFVSKHATDGGRTERRSLVQWESSGRKVLWSLWDAGDLRTGFSWGVVK